MANKKKIVSAALALCVGCPTLVRAAQITVTSKPFVESEVVVLGSPFAQTSTDSTVERFGTDESRIVYEWALPAMASGATINGVSLSEHITGISSGNPFVSIHGYAGDGKLSNSDATVPFNNIGQSNPLALGNATINMSTAYVQSLVNTSRPYLGTMLYQEQANTLGTFSRPGAGSSVPAMQITASVPDSGTVHAKPMYDVLGTKNGSTYDFTDGDTSLNLQQVPAINLDRRGFLSYDLFGIPNGASITSASITFNSNTITTDGTNYPIIGVYARLDDGILTASDLPFGTLVGTSDPITSSSGSVTVNLDTTEMQTIRNAGGYFGVTVLASTNGQQYGFYTSEFSVDSAPTLNVSYAVPEPASLGVLVPGLLLLARRRR